MRGVFNSNITLNDCVQEEWFMYPLIIIVQDLFKEITPHNIPPSSSLCIPAALDLNTRGEMLAIDIVVPFLFSSTLSKSTASKPASRE